MKKTPIGPTIAVSSLLVGTLLVWGGITNRNPVGVLKAVLGGQALPAAGTWFPATPAGPGVNDPKPSPLAPDNPVGPQTPLPFIPNLVPGKPDPNAPENQA